MENPADIVVPVTAKPAVVKAGPWVTFVVKDKNGAEVAHMDSATDGTQPHVIDNVEEAYPLTIVFTQHEAPAKLEAPVNDVPSGAVASATSRRKPKSNTK